MKPQELIKAVAEALGHPVPNTPNVGAFVPMWHGRPMTITVMASGDYPALLWRVPDEHVSEHMGISPTGDWSIRTTDSIPIGEYSGDDRRAWLAKEVANRLYRMGYQKPAPRSSQEELAARVCKGLSIPQDAPPGALTDLLAAALNLRAAWNDDYAHAAANLFEKLEPFSTPAA